VLTLGLALAGAGCSGSGASSAHGPQGSAAGAELLGYLRSVHPLLTLSRTTFPAINRLSAAARSRNRTEAVAALPAGRQAVRHLELDEARLGDLGPPADLVRTHRRLVAAVRDLARYDGLLVAAVSADDLARARVLASSPQPDFVHAALALGRWKADVVARGRRLHVRLPAWLDRVQGTTAAAGSPA
jgi:hypothetical protein